MSSRIEDYALVGDRHSAALISRDGSVDWLCLPRFDSGACFAALLGTPEHGRWLIRPVGEVRSTSRKYRGGTLILETTFTTDTGTVKLLDFMPPRTKEPDLVRLVRCTEGQVAMTMHLVLRFDYGSIIPWVRRTERGLSAVAGPDAVAFDCPVEVRGENLTTVAEFTVRAGEEVPFVLMWHPSSEPPPPPLDADWSLRSTEQHWHAWSRRCKHAGPYRDAVVRSLITLKALTYAPTGGIVAAPTTSLPEHIGGIRNWDYRYCWVRDATFTLYALLNNGYTEEAQAWRDWLLRAVAGNPAQMNIMYGISGERRLSELELKWLPGYENSAPVRIGNAAHEQFQLDVFGELISALYVARRKGLPPDDNAWRLQTNLLDYLEEAWKRPDEGIWEVRGPRRHFTHSKVMAWVAFDRMIRSVKKLGEKGPVERWKAQRDAIHAEVCDKGFDPKRNTFVQSYGDEPLDAALLTIPLVGFLPPGDPRIVGTVDAIRKELLHDGFVARYPSGKTDDGLPPGEGVFLPCTFWLADNLALQGKHDEAKELFEKLLGLCNDVGLISEEYDPQAKRLLGNFPQAFTHICLLNTAHHLRQGGDVVDE